MNLTQRMILLFGTLAVLVLGGFPAWRMVQPTLSGGVTITIARGFLVAPPHRPGYAWSDCHPELDITRMVAEIGLVALLTLGFVLLFQNRHEESRL